MNIKQVWKNIKAHEGETFYTVRGYEFTYQVSGNAIRVNRANQNLTYSNFEQTIEMWPVNGPGELSQTIRGSAYVYALLADARISE